MSSNLKISQFTKITNAGYPSDLYRLEYEAPSDGIKDAAILRAPQNGRNDWMVVIHGHGSHETQLYMRQDVRQVQLMTYLKLGIGIITPNLRNNGWMGPKAVDDMDAILDYLRTEYSAERFFFESGSMGATSNLIYGALRPQNVSGVVARGAATDIAEYYRFCRRGQDELPIRGEIADCIQQAYGGTPEQCPDVYRRHSPLYNTDSFSAFPTYLAHGTNDALMPVAQSRRFAAAMAENPLFTYVEVPGGEHDAPLWIPCQDENYKFNTLDWILR